MTQSEKNLALAFFDGWVRHPGNPNHVCTSCDTGQLSSMYCTCYLKEDWFIKDRSDVMIVPGIFYDSYEEMMPLVERIEKGNFGFKMCRKVVEVYFDDTKEVILKVKLDCRKASLFEALYQFVEWATYNRIEI